MNRAQNISLVSECDQPTWVCRVVSFLKSHFTFNGQCFQLFNFYFQTLTESYNFSLRTIFLMKVKVENTATFPHDFYSCYRSTRKDDVFSLFEFEWF